MPSFVKGGTARTPFGKNEYLRSTQDVKFESYTVAASTVTAQTIDGNAGQKILQPGTVMAKITSGTDAGKIGPFQRGVSELGAAAVNEVQTLTITATGGTYTLTYGGETTAALAYNANAAAIKVAFDALPGVDPADVAVTGTGPFVFTFSGAAVAGKNVGDISVTTTALTGGSASIANTTAGAPRTLAGQATDGRGDPANIVGLNDTFLPWQLIEHDCEIAVAYQCQAVQGWCLEYNAAGTAITLTNATADAMRGGKLVQINFS